MALLRKKHPQQKSPKSFFGDEFNLPELEEKVLEFWRANHIFEKTLALRQAQGKKHFVFFEGPPYANGKPGIHHVLVRIYKDIILRYKTMQGFSVPRRAGWDTHGLPVEIAAEKSLGLKSKKDIEKYGIERFNEEAKKAVWLYKDEWEKMTERVGYWLDLKNAYITYEPKYIETIWWILAQIAKRKLLYKGHKVVPWCTRCGTALSSHELAQGYKETTDNSVYVKFKLKPGQKIGSFKTDDKTYILSWTTTPWTLPGNVALAVGEKIKYLLVKTWVPIKYSSFSKEKLEITAGYYIFANTKENLLKFQDIVNPKDFEQYLLGKKKPEEFENTRVLNGQDLVGLQYEPLFKIPALKNNKSHKIYPADFVTTMDGTGVVHTAVMYGEDDYALGKKVGLPEHHTVDEIGKFTKDVPGGLAGMYVKSSETEKKIFKILEKRGNLLKIETYAHEYPYCWRCETPIIYYARNSWFIAMSKLRAELLVANKKINWIPEHIKEGRFGEWLREAKDWNLSRERYWGAPLPIWECEKCTHHEIVGSLEELSEKIPKRNTFYFVRHGEATSNIDGIEVAPKDTPKYTSRLTEKGKAAVHKIAKYLARKKIDLIISSPRVRTKETATIISKTTGAPIKYREALHDINVGIFALKKIEEWKKYFNHNELRAFAEPPPQGESRNEVKARICTALQEIDRAYSGKNILIVSHGDPLWLLNGAMHGFSNSEILKLSYPKTGQLYDISWQTVPLNEAGELDLHRPYIDEIIFPCPKCLDSPDLAKRDKGTMRRVKEVIDVWFDSGAMPFAQANFPFAFVQNQKSIRQLADKNQNFENIFKKLDYPADYICEGMDQTRGWFYTLLAIATALGYEVPYKNVVSLGLINDKFGKKMSKSKGNIVDPWAVIGKYGADAVRWYFYAASPPGEPKNFDEQEILKTSRRVHAILYNSFIFWQTYAKKSISNFSLFGRSPVGRQFPISKNILDVWIQARLNRTIQETTKQLDAYDIRGAALSIEALIDDLSRWYIRRSRRRLQRPKSQRDFEAASATLGYVLFATSKLIAPFNPFFAEVLYGEFGHDESVHLENWPKANPKMIDKKLIEAMAEVRRVASIALAKRAEAGIKVRQPLTRLEVRGSILGNQSEYQKLLNILQDEVNVKEIVIDSLSSFEVILDTNITAELREEGILRELVRTVQGLRQDAKLTPKDKITVIMELPAEIRGIIERHEKILKADVNAKMIEYKKSPKFGAEISTKLENQDIWVAVRKA